ncbi:MAG: response regulator [Planctomycetes bacterium]|nr:response regulator [Planctomycetota bacterium]
MDTTVLVIDDESDTLEMVATILEVNGYRVLLAESASRALEILKTAHVDLILLDLAMPGMDGFEFCWELHRAHREENVPIVVLTALDTYPWSNEFLATLYDIRECLHKPFQPVDLLEGVRRALLAHTAKADPAGSSTVSSSSSTSLS